MPEAHTDRIARQFRECTLPEEEWTHEAHLHVGLWHLLRHSPTATLNKLRDGIRKFNTAIGIVNSDTSGYHETLTRFYVEIVAGFLADRDVAEPIDRLAAAVIEACGDRGLPLVYYSRDRLFSKRARRQWVEPDLRPMRSLTGLTQPTASESKPVNVSVATRRRNEALWKEA